MEKEFLDDWSKSQFAQMIIAFTTGVILSPISGSILFVIFFSIPYDLYLCKTDKKYNILLRLLVMLCYLLGWGLGKIIFQIPILVTTKEKDIKYMKDKAPYHHRHTYYETDSEEDINIDDITFYM